MTTDLAPERHADEQMLDATIEDVIFRSEDGRFVVTRAAREDRDDHLTVVGDLGAVSVGETLRLRGRWTEHPVYGRRFRAEGFTPVMPSTRAGMTRYLGSGLVPGVGPAIAERLVRRFGDRTLEVIATQSGKLREVEGIGPRRAEAIAEAVRARRVEAESLSFLHGLGLGPATARRILRRYGDQAARVVREDPYLVAEQVRGIGFRTADRIGAACGIAPDDPRRAAGAALHLVGRAVDDGHVFITREQLLMGGRELDVPEGRVREAVEQLAERDLLVVEDDAVYAPPLHSAERAVASQLRALAGPRRVKTPVTVADDSLSEAQLEAVRASLQEGLLVLTGGPGTGKTTTVRAIVRAHLAAEHRVLLCAPTGRAAKRLTEAAGYEARTIHRLLEWNPKTNGFKRGSDAPLDAELVLVDEASMLDLLLAQSLLGAVPASARLVLVGDVDQLPPVGAGQVLRDLIESRIGRVVRLTQVFRQAQQSAIVRGAHAILAGRAPTPTPAGHKQNGELFIIPATDPESIGARLRATLRRAQASYGFDPRHDVQVLTPMRRGALGTEQLNLLLQSDLNPSRETPGLFRPGDKVMQLRNDYDRDVFNGDLGEVRRIEGGITYVLMDGRELQYKLDDLDALTLAYACTIHKVQGSEFPAVILILHGSHHMLLSRALLYTAVTRAKRLAVIIGDPRAIQRAARNAVTYQTQSRLVDRLRQEA